MNPSLELVCRFEKGGPAGRNVLAEFGTAVERTVRDTPLALATCAFAHAANLCSGRYDFAVGWRGEPAMRLRAIERLGQPLLELAYTPSGHLARACYADGNHVDYGWDNSGRLRWVGLGAGRRIELSWNADGQPASAQYPSGQEFVYRYAEWGGLAECVYPDTLPVRYEYDSQCRLRSSTHGERRFEYEYDSKGTVSAWWFLAGDKFRGAVAVHNSEPMPIKRQLLPGGDLAFSHALGWWRFGRGQQLTEMFSLGGVRRCLHANGGGEAEAWGPDGLWTFVFDRAGLTSTIDPRGIRTLYWRIPGSPHILVVNPMLARVQEHDGGGRVNKVRAGDGSFVVYRRGPRGEVEAITTGEGRLRLRRDKAGLLIEARSSTGWTGLIRRGESGQPSALMLRTDGVDPWRRIQQFGDVVWEWVGLRGALPFDEPAGKER